jgi:acyl carrier protein
MGLDLVELVLEVEDAFDLKIPDQDLERIRTVGALIQYVRFRVGSRAGEFCPTSRTFYRLRRELMKALPLAREQIHPRANLETLIPASKRRRVWRQLYGAGLELPPLRLTTSVRLVGTILVFGLTVALACWYSIGLALVLALPAVVLTWLMTRPLAIHPHPSGAVRTAVLYLTPFGTLGLGGGGVLRPSDREIAEKLRLIISENLAVPIDAVTDEARFVEDLGAS